ncbi:MAG: hypothetical protein JNK14_07390 [Chitinophagaceae bacterium]|nr:hypothetical protein [Chitinophagaceae bacterium]
MKTKICSLASIVLFLFPATSFSQMITGVWKGKINRQKAEVKIIQNGDSLTGTSYYYESPGNYRRYSIKGYFDAATNEAVWWDDQLLEEKSGKYSLSAPGKMPLLSRADFNCPGDGKMMLDGKSGKVYDEELKGDVHLDKTEYGQFEDEWDFVINNYLTGANDPYIIDSISSLRTVPLQPQAEEPEPVQKQAPLAPVIHEKPVVKEDPKPVAKTPEPVKPQTIEEKFVNRKKVLITEIPVTGDSVELRFYDNAEIDGDSISLFLNDKLIFQHIRLLGSAYTITLPVSELNATNELIMVAENLGSIPPNTSYMVALVGDKRYEARLESTEGSSAMIRFVKKGIP